MMTTRPYTQKRIAIISVHAVTLIGFRGHLIQCLVKKGFRVCALAPDFDASTREAIEALGADPIDISFMRTGMNPLVDFRDTYRLSQVLRRIKPHVTLGYYVKPVVFGTVAAWIAGVPHRVAMIEGLGFIYTDDGTNPSLKKRIIRFIVSELYRFSLSRAHAVAFLNPDDIKDFICWGIVNPQKIVELGGIGVDLEKWTPHPPVVEPIRFLFIGRLLREKGIYEFVDAARIVKKAHPEVEFVVLGDVDSNPGSIQAAQICTWVNEGLLIWPGHVPTQPWLAKSSVFVLPSYREGIPRSTQEAMAMGLPVITTDVPGCRQTVDDGINGFLIPVRNPEALVNAMLRFINQPELIAPMGRESRRLAEDRFDVHQANTKLMSIMRL